MKRITLLLFAIQICTTISAQSVTAISFNLRYDNAGDNENRWELRKEAVVECINDYKPDLLGTQEGLTHQIEYLEESLPQYKRVGVAREDGLQEGEYSAIFYNSDRFTLIKSENIWLSETPDKPSFGWDAACKRITTIAILRDKKCGKVIHFINTHFDHAGQEARRQSPRLILDRVAQAEGQGVIFTGDLNAYPDSEPIEILTQSGKLKDSHAEAKAPKGPNYSYHGFKDDIEQTDSDTTIDYIMYNNLFKVKKYITIDKRYQGKMVSDHYPVFAELKYIK